MAKMTPNAIRPTTTASVGSMPKYSASPPTTPAIIRWRRERRSLREHANGDCVFLTAQRAAPVTDSASGALRIQMEQGWRYQGDPAEPGFKIVAEWADYRVTSDLRLADLAMDKFFEWMDAHRYRFEETFAIHLIALFGRFASLLSNDAKNLIADVVPKVPANMRRRTIATIAMLHQTSETVLGELRTLERRSHELTGRPLHPREVLAALEAIRAREGDTIGYLVRR